MRAATSESQILESLDQQTISERRLSPYRYAMNPTMHSARNVVNSQRRLLLISQERPPDEWQASRLKGAENVLSIMVEMARSNCR